jgi:outer membrane protein assembly factor BamB
MQLRKTLLVGWVSVALLSGCSLFGGEEDVVKMSPLPKVENQFTPTEVWSTSVGDGVGQYYSHLHPAWQDNTIYAADRFGIVKALDASNGKEKWKVDLSENPGFFSSNISAELSGGVTVDGSNLYIGSEKAIVYSLNTADGKLAWKTTVAGEAISRPVVSGGLILIHTSNGILQALNQKDGSIAWSANLDMPTLSLRGESAPAVAFGAAIVGGDNGRVSAVLLKEGQMIWQQRISEPSGATEIDRLSDIDTTPVIVNGVVYTVAYNGNLVAMDLRSGQIMWKRDVGSVNNIVIDGDRIYMVDQNDRVMALNTQGGVTIWTQSALLHRLVTAPVLYNGYLVDSSGLLSAPIVASDKLVVQAKGGEVYSFQR